MNSQIQISDLEDIISEKIFIKIEKWNLYLGDAGLARNLALECISNLDKGSQQAAKLGLEEFPRPQERETHGNRV